MTRIRSLSTIEHMEKKKLSCSIMIRRMHAEAQQHTLTHIEIYEHIHKLLRTFCRMRLTQLPISA